jgi:hypothetical protein
MQFDFELVLRMEPGLRRRTFREVVCDVARAAEPGRDDLVDLD